MATIDKSLPNTKTEEVFEPANKAKNILTRDY